MLFIFLNLIIKNYIFHTQPCPFLGAGGEAEASFLYVFNISEIFASLEEVQSCFCLQVNATTNTFFTLTCQQSLDRHSILLIHAV